MTDEHATRNTNRKMSDGLPPKAQIAFAFTAIVAGVSIALRFHQGGMETSLALPLGLFVGITGVTLVTAVLWALDLWVSNRND